MSCKKIGSERESNPGLSDVGRHSTQLLLLQTRLGYDRPGFCSQLDPIFFELSDEFVKDTRWNNLSLCMYAHLEEYRY